VVLGVNIIFADSAIRSLDIPRTFSVTSGYILVKNRTNVNYVGSCLPSPGTCGATCSVTPATHVKVMCVNDVQITCSVTPAIHVKVMCVNDVQITCSVTPATHVKVMCVNDVQINKFYNKTGMLGT
jgi:translation initiation factor IF-1